MLNEKGEQSMTEELTKAEETAVATIGKLAEEFFNNRVDIELLEEQKKKINAKQGALIAKIKTLMENNELQKVGTDFGSLTMTEKEGWKVDDWDKFFDFVFKSDSPEFLQHRFGTPAVKEFFLRTGKLPAGMSMNPYTDLAQRIDSKYKSERLAKLRS
jgi:hypothetical protein